MGVEDSIRKATENAMEDLAGTSDPVDNGHVPEPGQKDDDIQVHSSISEGSNAMDSDVPGENGAPGRHRADGAPDGGWDRRDQRDDAGAQQENGNTPKAEGDVSGPAGLPENDPDDLRADPSEGGTDPSTSMGRS
ncbi:hypothetical protein AB4Y77_05630 [Paenarthrobacter sp. YAF11_1]|uniref:hypothetical protein n=1 Tax=Micrococcaceae TaxID=1268 RepID=UPI0028832E1B|nr:MULTISPECIES: hypothetical protein [unclassified Arthrobacter]